MITFNRQKLIAMLFAGCVVIGSTWLLAKGIINFRSGEPKINVTGMAEKQITSDLIVWNVTANSEGYTRSEAYAEYKHTARQIKNYLQRHGISGKELEVSSVNISASTEEVYDKDRGSYVTVNKGFSASQTFTVTSKNLPKIERAYQEINELYDMGLDFNSDAPLYYYTKLNDLKMQMLKEASSNAYERAKTIAEGSDAGVGALLASSMGVFQIVGLNSDEEYSWGGTFNTSSKEKTASITVKATYKVK